MVQYSKYVEWSVFKMSERKICWICSRTENQIVKSFNSDFFIKKNGELEPLLFPFYFVILDPKIGETQIHLKAKEDKSSGGFIIRNQQKKYVCLICGKLTDVITSHKIFKERN